MSNARSKSNNAARNTRPTAARKQQNRKPKQLPMAASNKWMLILGVGFLALRLIFPDIMAILGSSLTGLTVVAVIAVVLAIAAYLNNLSVPGLFNGLMGAVNNRKAKRPTRRVPSRYEEDDFDDDDEEDEVYDDYDDYDDSPVVESVVVEEEPPVAQMHRRRRPVEAVVVEEEPQTPSFAEAVQKPEYAVPDGYEWKLVDGKWAIQPMTPPEYAVPDGFEWSRQNGKWEIVPKA